MFDPELLTTFIVVARTAGFSAAGRELGVRQSTISGQIARLERQVGRRLFERDSHSVTLTPDGSTMLGFARGVLDSVDAIEGYFNRADETSGLVRIGLCHDLAAALLEPTLRQLRDSHPSIDLDIRIESDEALHAMVERNQLDVVAAKARPGYPSAARLSDDDLVWAGASATPYLDESPLPIVVLRQDRVADDIGRRALDAARIVRRSACVVNDHAALCAAVRAGLGVAVTSRHSIPAGCMVREDLPPLRSVGYSILHRPGPISGASEVVTRTLLSIDRATDHHPVASTLVSTGEAA